MILTGFAGLFASACSMAIGEFVSVYSQLDIEVAQKKGEKRTVANNVVLSDEDKENLPNHFQEARTSALLFSLGAIFPLLGCRGDIHSRSHTGALGGGRYHHCGFGGVGAVLGWTNMVKSCVKVLVGGWMAMGITFGLTKLLGSSGLQMWLQSSDDD